MSSQGSRAHRYEPDIHPTYHDLAHYYGVAVRPARVRKPRDKAKAEVEVQVVERWVLAAVRTKRRFRRDRTIQQELSPAQSTIRATRVDPSAAFGEGDRSSAGCEGPVVIACAVQLVAEPSLGETVLRTERGDVAGIRKIVEIDPGLPLGEQAQYRENRAGRGKRSHTTPSAESGRAVDRATHEHGQRTDARQVLEAVGDEGESHEAEIDEAEYRGEGQREEQRTRERAAPDPFPGEPQRRAEGGDSDEGEPSERVA